MRCWLKRLTLQINSGKCRASWSLYGVFFFFFLSIACSSDGTPGSSRPNEFAISAVAGPEPASAQQESGYLPFYAHPDYEQSVDDQYDYESLMYNRESQEAASRERFTNEPKFEPERRSLHDGATELKITTALDFTMPESQPVPRSAPPHSIMEEALASGKNPTRFNAPREDTTGTSSEILPPIPPKVPYGAHEGESRPSFKPFDPTLDYQGPSRSQP